MSVTGTGGSPFFVGEYLRGIQGMPLRPDHLAFRPGVTMLRHFEEVFEG